MFQPSKLVDLRSFENQNIGITGYQTLALQDTAN